MAIKNANKQARPTALAIINALKGRKELVSSITFDQGSEFADFALIKLCLDADVYFCTPASPEEKGGIENRNGVLRTVYQRDCDIVSVSQDDIDLVLDSINTRPMLCLNFQSPQMVFERQKDFANEINW